MSGTIPEAAQARDLPRNLREWTVRLRAPAAFLVTATLVLAVAAADQWLGPGIDLTLLYLLPVGMAAYFGGVSAGVGMAVLAAASSFTVAREGAQAPALAVLAWNAGQALGVFLVLVLVLDAFHRRLLRERQAARTDPLTALANRRGLIEAASRELERARRHGRPISLLYLDADDFKVVNDRHGHAVGDEVLLLIGRTLQECVRSHDVVARLGGDEFGVLLPEFDGSGAAALTDRVRTRLAEVLGARGLPVTFSAGVATFATPPASVDEMILRADGLMYDAKRTGKDGRACGVWGAVGQAA